MIIKNWQLCFQAIHGDKNQLSILEAFSNFLNSPNVTTLMLSGHCQISGKLHGTKKHNGSAIVTSYVVSIEKVPSPPMTAGVITTKMVAKTKLGKEYTLFFTDANQVMRRMLKRTNCNI